MKKAGHGSQSAKVGNPTLGIGSSSVLFHLLVVKLSPIRLKFSKIYILLFLFHFRRFID